MKTRLVDDVAKEVVKRNFRGCVLGQQGMFLDKQALIDSASGFNINDYMKHVESLHAYNEAYGDLKF